MLCLHRHQCRNKEVGPSGTWGDKCGSWRKKPAFWVQHGLFCTEVSLDLKEALIGCIVSHADVFCVAGSMANVQCPKYLLGVLISIKNLAA